MRNQKPRLIYKFAIISLLILMLFYSFPCGSTDKVISATSDTDRLNRIKKAIVHLECATNTLSYDEQTKYSQELKTKLERKEITPDEFKEKLTSLGNRGKRSFGTAIFLEHDNKRYLLSARHVLEDTTGGPLKIKADDYIYDYIFRVPSLDDLFKPGEKPLPFLMNMFSESQSYTFSIKEIDLAIISLDSSLIAGKIFRFADKLISLGHQPLTLEDIADEPSSEGANVVAVCYPLATSNLGEFRLDTITTDWRASIVSLPTLAFGRVSMLNDRLNVFVSDIATYPGCSGGPIFEAGKLVGVTIQQPVESGKVFLRDKGHEQEMALYCKTHIPFSIAVKARFIKELLQTQLKKEKRAGH